MACTVLALAAGAAAAGTVDVVYVKSDQFTDARDSFSDESFNLKTLTECFQQLGKQYLPSDQTLQVEVLDVDLAGDVRWTSRWGSVRVVGRTTDIPRVTLRYRLMSGGQLVSQGEETVSDLGYSSNLGRYTSQGNLGIEKRMLQRWFQDRLVKN